MSPALHVLENEVQLAALAFMAIIYFLRLRWLFRFRAPAERTWAAGSERKGIVYSLAGVALPGSTESGRRRPGFYVQFVVFHIGVAAAIGGTFVIPYAPGLFRLGVLVRVFQAVLGAAFLVALMRLVRRVSNPVLRAVSTPDDYASLILMILYFAAAALAVPNTPEKGEAPLFVYFGLTALFLVYVPFSKICHYLYYPFTRYFLGRTLGHRGVLPPRPVHTARAADVPGRPNA
jgi:nitrate reductase gamma subunit